MRCTNNAATCSCRRTLEPDNLPWLRMRGREGPRIESAPHTRKQTRTRNTHRCPLLQMGCRRRLPLALAVPLSHRHAMAPQSQSNLRDVKEHARALATRAQQQLRAQCNAHVQPTRRRQVAYCIKGHILLQMRCYPMATPILTPEMGANNARERRSPTIGLRRL